MTGQAVAQGRRPLWAASVLIAVLVAMRMIISLRGYLLQDDFAVRYRAATQGWSIDYAFEPYNDHISPVGYSLQWLLQWMFPGSHIALVLATSVLLVITLGCTGAFVWILTERFVAVAITSVVLGLGLLTFEVGTWWTVSLYSMTYLAFLAFALWALARVLRFEAYKAGVLAGFAGAALSDSKGFLGIIVIFGVAAGIDVTGHGRLGMRGAWRRLRWVWLSALAVSGGLIALSAWSTSGVQGSLTLARAVRMMRDLWVVNIAPAVFGGPWWWDDVPTAGWEPTRVLPATPGSIGFACLLLTLAGLAFVVRRRPHIAGFVPYAILYSLATTAVPVVGRAGTALASLAYRYTYDVAVPLSILMSLAVVPLWWQKVEARRWAWAVPVGLAVSMMVSTVAPAVAWGRNEAKDYVRRAVSGFGSIPAGHAVIPQGVPEDLVPALLLWPYANTEAVLAPQPGAPVFGEVSPDPLLGFGAGGSLQRQDIVGPQSLPGPDSQCGYAITDIPRLVPLDGELIPWEFLARVAYFSGVDTTMYVAVGGQIHTVPLPASELTAVSFPVAGPGREVLISIGTPGATVCVTEVRVGNRTDPDTGAVVPLVPKGLPE